MGLNILFCNLVFSTMAVVVISLNVGGIRSPQRARAILDYVSGHRFDVALLQETHLDQGSLTNIKDNWSGGLYHSDGSSHTSGVAILTKQKINAEEVWRDDSGRALGIRIKLNDRYFSIFNIYAPSGDHRNSDRKEFFHSLLTLFPEPKQGDMVIVGGDFNMTVSPLDRFSTRNPSNSASYELHRFLCHCRVEDYWRITNPKGRYYTHIQNSTSGTRIDRIYTSQWARPFVTVNHSPSMISDHSMVIARITEGGVERGKGSWCFNNSLLQNQDFVDSVKLFWDVWKMEKDSFCCLADWWDKGKSEIKKIAIEFSASIKEAEKKHLKSLEKRIRNLEKKVGQSGVSTRLSELRKQVFSYHDKHARAALIRSRMQHELEGERCNTYFFNLEKSRQGLP